MLRLNVGTSRKIGQPDFGSAGASCNLEVELDTGLFQDLDGLQQVVRRAYAACNQAVDDELARLQRGSRPEVTANVPYGSDTRSVLQQPDMSEPVNGRTTPAEQPATASRIPTALFTRQLSPRPATASQVRAIRAICARRRIDLVGLLRERFGVHTAHDLGIRQASDLIDELKGEAEPRTAAGVSTHRGGGQAEGHTSSGNGVAGTYQQNGGT